MTREQKDSVTRRARAEQLSVGDYMRRQALGDDAMLTVLLDELRASTARASQALDATLARLDAAERRRPELEADARTRALAEVKQWSSEQVQRAARTWARSGVDAGSVDAP